MTPVEPVEPVEESPPRDWNYADVWELIAAHRPDDIALIHADTRWTWSRFESTAEALATWFTTENLPRAAYVALCLRNRPEYLVTLFACFKAGLVPVNNNFRYTSAELAELWSHAAPAVVVYDASTQQAVEAALAGETGARGIFVDGDSSSPPTGQHRFSDISRPSAAGPARRRDGPQRSGDDHYLLFTGGTTGTPKGVIWKQADLFALLNSTARRPYSEKAGLAGVRRRLLDGAVDAPGLVLAVPLIHGLGSLTAMTALSCGGTVTTLAGRSFHAAELLDAIDQVGATQAVIAGDAFARPMLEVLGDEPERWSLQTLRVLLSSGTRWSEETKERLSRHLPRVRCVDVLGATEAIGVASAVTRAGVRAVGGPGNARFTLGPATRVVDADGEPVRPGSGQVGRLMVRGRSPIGYLGDPHLSEQTFRDIEGERWTLLGDLATVDVDGHITLIGRGSSVINTAGEKVHPDEVEAVLLRLPEVEDCAVVGVDDEVSGQRVVALLQLKAGIVLDSERILKRLDDSLARYKRPRTIHQVARIRRDAAGKIDRSALASLAQDLGRDAPPGFPSGPTPRRPRIAFDDAAGAL